MKEGDFDKMLGQDIDAFLDDSEFDIQSMDKMSHYSRGDNMNDAKLKAMEKVYLQRIEGSGQKEPALAGSASKTKLKAKKPPAFREFQEERFAEDQKYQQEK